MEYRTILEVLGFAAGNQRPVAIRTHDGHRIAGVPTNLDAHPTALEVYLHPAGDEDTEIAISLTAIAEVELT